MVSFMPDARRVSLITRTVSCSGVRAPTRSRPPGSVGGMRSMPHRRSTSSYRSISRSRSGRKVGGSTESTEASSVASTAQPRRTRMSSMKSAGMSAPIMATKRGMRKIVRTGGGKLVHVHHAGAHGAPGHLGQKRRRGLRHHFAQMVVHAALVAHGGLGDAPQIAARAGGAAALEGGGFQKHAGGLFGDLAVLAAARIVGEAVDSHARRARFARDGAFGQNARVAQRIDVFLSVCERYS